MKQRGTKQTRSPPRLCPCHKLFEGIAVKLKDGVEFPQSFADYEVICQWDNADLPAGVRLHKQHE